MVDGGTETRIGVTYDDTNGRLNFVVDDMTANTTYSTATSSTEGLVKIGFTESGKKYHPGKKQVEPVLIRGVIRRYVDKSA